MSCGCSGEEGIESNSLEPEAVPDSCVIWPTTSVIRSPCPVTRSFSRCSSAVDHASADVAHGVAEGGRGHQSALRRRRLPVAQHHLGEATRASRSHSQLTPRTASSALLKSLTQRLCELVCCFRGKVTFPEHDFAR